MPVLSPYVTGLRPWAVYNEWDRDAAEWIRQLIKMDLIAPGEVDERSILDVSADDYRKFTQQHFFAGVATWSYCLRAGGIGDDFPVLTGSPPCQPFSVAGRSEGRDDERHLAPKFGQLITELRPGLVFGEQVSSSLAVGKAREKPAPIILDGEGNAEDPEWAWIDALSDQMEEALYACGSYDVPAAGFGAPHIRQRLLFFANAYELEAGTLNDAQRSRLEGLSGDVAGIYQPGWEQTLATGPAAEGGAIGVMADSRRPCGQWRTNTCGPAQTEAEQRGEDTAHDQPRGCDGDMADTEREQRFGRGSSQEVLAPGSIQRAERLRDVGGLGNTEGVRCGYGAKDRGLGGQKPAVTQKTRERDGQAAGVAGRAQHMADSDRERREGVEVSAGQAERTGCPQEDPEAVRICGSGELVGPGPDFYKSGADFHQCLDDALARLDAMRPCPTNGSWRNVDWLHCRDGKWRPTEPGIEPLVDGSSRRMGFGGYPGIPLTEAEANYSPEGRQMRLKGYGNGIATDPTIAHIQACVRVMDAEIPGWRRRAIQLAESLTISVN